MYDYLEIEMEELMNTIYLIRHGQTVNNVARSNLVSTYNYEKKCPDPALNEIGIKQAHLLGKRLERCHVDMIYTSDLLRAQQTSAIINEYLNKDIITRVELREFDMGELHLRSREDIKDEYPEFYNSWDKHETDMPYPNGECGKDVEKRAMKIINEVIEKDIQSTLIVTHGGVIRVLLSVFLGLPLENRFNFWLENCGINIARFDREKGRFKVDCINDSAHLEGFRLPEAADIKLA